MSSNLISSLSWQYHSTGCCSVVDFLLYIPSLIGYQYLYKFDLFAFDLILQNNLNLVAVIGSNRWMLSIWSMHIWWYDEYDYKKYMCCNKSQFVKTNINFLKDGAAA